MLIQLTLQDLVIYIVYALGIVAGVLLIIVLWNIKKIVSIFRSLLEINQDTIKKTIKPLPKIIEDVEQISSNLRDTADKLKVSTPVILEEAQSVTHAAKES